MALKLATELAFGSMRTKTETDDMKVVFDASVPSALSKLTAGMDPLLEDEQLHQGRTAGQRFVLPWPTKYTVQQLQAYRLHNLELQELTPHTPVQTMACGPVLMYAKHALQSNHNKAHISNHSTMFMVELLQRIWLDEKKDAKGDLGSSMGEKYGPNYPLGHSDKPYAAMCRYCFTDDDVCPLKDCSLCCKR